MPLPPITPPATVADFKAYWTRGWRYGTGPDAVTDADITKGIQRALSLWNPMLWNDQEKKGVFLLSCAHFVARDIQNAGGLRAAQSMSPDGYAGAVDNTDNGMPIGTKSEGKMSQQAAGLDFIIERHPILAPFRGTGFGADFAALAAGRLVGRVGIVSNPNAPDAVVPAVPFLA